MAETDISMFQLAVELQQAKDAHIEDFLNNQSQEIQKINERSLFISQLIQKLLIERNKDEDHVDLTPYEDQINEFLEKHHPNSGFHDPFYGLNLPRVDLHELDRATADLQEIMRRDANELQRIGRDNEFAVHLYTVVTEMMTRQKPDECKTMIRNQRPHG